MLCRRQFCALQRNFLEYWEGVVGGIRNEKGVANGTRIENGVVNWMQNEIRAQ